MTYDLLHWKSSLWTIDSPLLIKLICDYEISIVYKIMCRILYLTLMLEDIEYES